MTAFTRRSALALGASAASLLAGRPIATSAQALTPIRTVGPGNDGYKAVFWGIRSGIFKRYGLDVSTTLVANGAAAAAALIGGSADVAYTNILTLVQAHDHGIPMTFIAGGNVLRPGKSPTLLLVSSDSPIKSGRDMNGKVLGSSSLKDINGAASLAWIEKNGGDPSSVKIVEVPASSGAAFLEEHRADAIVLNEPAASLAIASGKVRLLGQPYDALTGGMVAGFAAMEPNVLANRDAMVRFAKAMHEASAYTNAHQAETVPLVAEFSGIEQDVIAKSTRFYDAEYLEPRVIQPIVEVCAKFGLISKSFPAQAIISMAALEPGKH
jgi:NitT/TauT family transport system substrate-binding protein